MRDVILRTFLVALCSVIAVCLGQEDGRDQGNVGQVGAAEVGIVEDDDIARLPFVEDGERGRDAVGHRAQVCRDVGGLCHQPSGGVKERTGKVEAFFDVRGSNWCAAG